jgi:phosphatidylserine/phosphatidylglycerophosphate/cardiolipin synthase-like enzyme
MDSLEAMLAPLALNRNCFRRPYERIPVPPLKVNCEMTAYASPESTYAVTRNLLEAATRSILIGIYDFTAPYMRDLLIGAVGRGVKVSVMVDLDKRTGEPEVWQALIEGGCEGVPAPSCASETSRYFASCHEKVIVVDDTWTLVQSGNYSENSIPDNIVDGGDPAHFVPGNRDMGLAVKSPALAAFFTALLRRDMQLELDGRELLRPGEPEMLDRLPEAQLVMAAPQPPPRRFQSRQFLPADEVQMQPIISPENYMALIPGWLASAQHSIFIEQQYIRGHQPAIRELLGGIRSAMQRNPNLLVRIVLGRSFGETEKDRRSLASLAEFGLLSGTNVRFINQRFFVHCHNKLIVVDRKRALVSSQNWSDSAVTLNREAGLLVSYAPLARYYAMIFDADWETAQELDAAPPAAMFLPAGQRPAGEMVRINLGDHIEV